MNRALLVLPAVVVALCGADAARDPLDDTLTRAWFLLHREQCLFVEPTAPVVPTWALDKMFTLVPARERVARCGPEVTAAGLLHAVDDARALGTSAPDAKLAVRPVATPEQVRAVFAETYRKPSELHFGVPLQKLYDATVKDTVARIAVDVGVLVKDPKKLDAELKKLRAKDAKAQGGPDAWRGSLNALVKSDADAARIDPRLVAFVLRRQGDGTLPALLECLRSILADYDAGSLANLPPAPPAAPPVAPSAPPATAPPAPAAAPPAPR